MGSPRKFTKHGQCGMELSDLLPHLGDRAPTTSALIRSMHTDAFNHHPGQLMMNTGVPTFGRPSMGSWLNYGLGSESKNLPGYVVLTAGRGTSGGASNWSSGFLPSHVPGRAVPQPGRAGPEPEQPRRASPTTMQAQDHRRRCATSTGSATQQIGDPEINSRIAAYELAFRMQSAAPELIDLSSETQATLDDVRRRPRRAGHQGAAAAAARGSSSRSPPTACWPAGWSSAACGSSTSIHASWDHHSNLDAELAFNCRHGRPAGRGAAQGPEAARPARRDAGGLGCRSSAARRWARTAPASRTSPAATITRSPSRIWMAGGGIKGGQVDRQDRRDRLERRRGPGPRQRPPRHDPAPVRPRPPEADLPLPGPRLPPDRRRRQGGEEAAGLSLAPPVSSVPARVLYGPPGGPVCQKWERWHAVVFLQVVFLSCFAIRDGTSPQPATLPQGLSSGVGSSCPQCWPRLSLLTLHFPHRGRQSRTWDSPPPAAPVNC